MSSDYHDLPGVSSSQIADFLDDPVYWWHAYVKKDWPRKEPTPAMRFGTICHRMLELGGPEHVTARLPESMVKATESELEMLRSDQLHVVPPRVLKDGRRAGKAYLDWMRDLKARTEGFDAKKHLVTDAALARIRKWDDFHRENADKLILSHDEINPMERIWDNVQANDFARAMVNADRKEEVIKWTDAESGFDCRLMADVIFEDGTHRVVNDWKTIRSISMKRLQSEFHDRHYAVRLAFYRRGVSTVLGNDWKVAITGIENNGSYRVTPIELSESWLEDADEKLTRTLHRMKTFDIDAELNQKPLKLEAPKWAKYETDYELEAV